MQSAAALAQQYDFDEAEEQELQQQEVTTTSAPKPQACVHEYHLDITDPPKGYGPAATSNYEYVRQAKQRPLLRYILADIAHNWFFFALCACLCAAAIFRITQVQQTRAVTSELNVLSETVDDLSNEWLGLLAKKEGLEKQSLIREAAVTELGMFQPKTEAEVVIVLDR